MIEIIHYLLMIVTIVLALITVKIKDITRAIGSFAILNVSISLMYFFLGAPFVAVFQLLVYAGAITVLFLVTLHTLRGEVK